MVIVAFKSAVDLPRLLDSVPDALGSLSWHALVVDNYGQDNVADSLASRPHVTVVSSGSNLGYSGGLNIGLSSSPSSRFTVFLNPDVVLLPGSLSQLVRACSVDGVAAAVPVVIDEEGVTQPSLRREPSALGALGEALFGDHWPGRPTWLAEMIRDPRAYRLTHDAEWATGAALAVRSDVLRAIGPWDSHRFFLYSEETDYCRRIRALGHRISFSPEAVVRHRGAGSGSSPELNALMAINKVRYFRKWHGSAASALFACITVVHSALRLGRPESRLTIQALFSAPARAALPGGSA
nr:glycosyltransferase family 2 protein [Cryobacterium roopkundense]